MFTFYKNNTLLYFSSALLLFLIQQQLIYFHKVNSQSTDTLIIRHGRSRVRHSTEKDHLRWGLKAFDNLTLEYDDVVDFEGSGNGTQTDVFGLYDINGTTTGLSTLLNNNTRYNNLLYNGNTTSFQINQPREREFIDSAQYLLPIKPSSTKANNRKNVNVGTATTTTTTTTQKLATNNKYVQKVAKKKIMENIKKDVDKGLEYLKMHSDVIDATVSLIDMKIKRNEAIIKLQQQQVATSSTIQFPSTSETSLPTLSSFSNNVQPIAKSDVVLRQIISEQQSIFSKLKPNSNNKFSDLEKNSKAPINKHDNNNREFYSYSTTTVLPPSSSPRGTQTNEKPIPIITKDMESESNENNLDELTFIMNDMEDLDGTNAAYQMEEIDLEDLDEVSRENRKNLIKGRDVVTTFLRIVESQHLLGANCTAGTALNLGEGVVDRYAQDRFRVEAEIAVNRANMLTR